MDGNLDETVSALADGELDRHEAERALRGLREDPGLSQRWERYHLIAEGVRNGLPQRVPLDLAEQIRHALRDEPPILAPRRGLRLPAGLVKQAAGLAAAASVTAVAILGVQTLDSGDGRATTTVNRVAGGNVAPPAARPIPVGAAPRHLDTYLLNHAEYSSGHGVRRMLPYVRIVSDE